MARRTKTDAMATRDKILDCAESLFVQRGVSRTTLQDIADAAAVTRGAIYWHFTDKADLFGAMLHRAKMPFESAMQALNESGAHDPLGDLEKYALIVFRLAETDLRARRVFEIATLKVEYVDDMSEVRTRRAEMTAQWMVHAESKLRSAIESGHVADRVDVRNAALGLWALIDGLLRAWVVEPTAFSLSVEGKPIVATFLAAIRDKSGALRSDVMHTDSTLLYR
ncbi:TetR family transcriptional regulator [Herbaspirillum rubrisubalbicans]|uniref:TetR family transcriptional regulator n=1 Tax=Herbaspirillum rubrisubalbicans TaxID=80842 RepID=UPI0015588344|nr:TetR family transcriptional regulator [Herbaspirillum rubrisubalbicans]NQE47223.1 hypothetical protein [Herbaspirillum rubrisubalbicans]